MKHAVGGGFGLLWWVGIILLGMIVPLVAGLKGGEKQPQVSLVLSALVLMGGLFLRYVILVVGQIPLA
jgi:protein NrfD